MVQILRSARQVGPDDMDGCSALLKAKPPWEKRLQVIGADNRGHMARLENKDIQISLIFLRGIGTDQARRYFLRLKNGAQKGLL